MRAKSILGIALAGLGLAAALGLSSCTQNATSITSSRYALVYGVKDYPLASGNNPLYWTVADADSIASTLSSQGWKVNTPSNSTNSAVTDSAVTKAKIKADILSLASVSSDSTILLYYSGHGTNITSSWGSGYYPAYSGAYICPYDSVESNTGSSSYGYIDSTTVSNLISPTELQAWIGQTGTKNIIILLDSCYSGGFIGSNSTIDGVPQNYGAYDDGTGTSGFGAALANFGALLVANASASGAKTPIVISASGSKESSMETSDLGHGVFTYYLLQAATSADSNGDGYVTTTEAYAYAAKGVKAYCLAQNWDMAYDSSTGTYLDYYPHISGGNRDLVLFTK